MKTHIHIIISFGLLFCLAIKGFSATVTASQSGNWSSTTTWGGSPIPIAGDVVVINTYTVTIDINTAACASISLGAGTTATIVFNNASKLTVSGNITLGGSGTRKGNLDFTSGGHLVTATFSNWAGTFTRGTGTVEITGTIALFGSADYWNFYHLILSGTANVTFARNIACYGNLTIGAGTTLTSNSNYLNLYGDWTINATATFNGGATSSDYVVFYGANTQNIYGNVTLHNVWANKTSNNPIVLSGTVTINNVIWWDRSIFTYTGAGNLILVAGYSDANGAPNNQRCFALPVKKIGNSSYTYPLCSGNGVNFSPLTISAPALVTDAFTAQYYASNPNSAGYTTTSKEITLDHVSVMEYWTLDRTAGSSNSTVRLTWGSWSGGVTVLADLRVAKWNGSQWLNSGNTATTGTTASGTVTSSTVTTFSPFTLASSTPANPLPIELLSFSGRCNQQNVILKWSTATEINNNYFTLERNTDGMSWLAVGTVDGAGNSSSRLNYSFRDTEPYNGIFYYRLKQTNFNGQFKYSAVIAIKNCKEKVSELSIYPNPGNGTFNLLFSGFKEQVQSVKIYNILGERVYYSQSYQSVIDISDKPAGAYFVHFNLNGSNITEKIMIAK